jgi:hypothetical protein
MCSYHAPYFLQEKLVLAQMLIFWLWFIYILAKAWIMTKAISRLLKPLARLM